MIGRVNLVQILKGVRGDLVGVMVVVSCIYLFMVCTECCFVTLVGFVFDASFILWRWVLFVRYLLYILLWGIGKIGLFMCYWRYYLMSFVLVDYGGLINRGERLRIGFVRCSFY